MAGTVAVLFGRIGGKIGELQLDANLSETHSYVNEVSQFPVEVGSDIIDNIKLNPDKITINGMVSNSPVSVLFSDVTDIVNRRGNNVEAKRTSRDGTPTRVESAQDILLRISGRKINGNDEEPELVTIVTGLRVYTDMALTNLNITRTGTTGQALPFTADFIKVQTVESETIAIPNTSIPDKASSTIDKGNQTPKVSNEEQEKSTSFVKGIFNAVKRGF